MDQNVRFWPNLYIFVRWQVQTGVL